MHILFYWFSSIFLPFHNSLAIMAITPNLLPSFGFKFLPWLRRRIERWKSWSHMYNYVNLHSLVVFHSYLSIIDATGDAKHWVVLRDFNRPGIVWNKTSGYYHLSDSIARKHTNDLIFMDRMNTYGLLQQKCTPNKNGKFSDFMAYGVCVSNGLSDALNCEDGIYSCRSEEKRYNGQQ